MRKLKINVEFEDQELYKGSFNTFPKARKTLKDLELKFR